MLWRTVVNASLFLLVLIFLYQAMEFVSQHRALVEMNAPYYEGGQGATPVAGEEELVALRTQANRAAFCAAAAFVVFLSGCGLQYLSLRRPRRSGAHLNG